MPRKILLEIALKRYQVQVKELEALHKNSVVNFGVDPAGYPDDRYTDYVTCQGTQPSRLSGEGHKKCSRLVRLMFAYKCLYCDFWFCKSCAGIHFGKTKEQHNKEMAEKEPV